MLNFNDAADISTNNCNMVCLQTIAMFSIYILSKPLHLCYSYEIFAQSANIPDMLLVKIHNEALYKNNWKLRSLTDLGRVKHICVSRLAISGSDNGLSPGRRPAIIWTNAGIL